MKIEKNEVHSGLLLTNKPPGLTSFESLRSIKKALSTGKVGHTGTLDKFASGLLLVLIGKALKMSPWFSYCDKEYQGQIRFGIETDTLDPEGKIIREEDIPSREAVEAVLSSFRGKILQAPPAYSAVHINGKRAYELSRQGIALEMKKRPVTIHELELISWNPPFAEIRVCCSTGTYIRSLARDIAIAAGSCSHLNSLVRTRIGGFSLSNAFAIEDFTNANAIRSINPDVFNALGLPYIYADHGLIQKISRGHNINKLIKMDLLKNIPISPVLGVFNDVELIAVIEYKNEKWSYGHVFADP